MYTVRYATYRAAAARPGCPTFPSCSSGLLGRFLPASQEALFQARWMEKMYGTLGGLARAQKGEE